MDPLEALFSSRVRVSLLRVLLAEPEREFYGRELAREAGERQSAVWRELQHLESIGLVRRHEREALTYFRVHEEFPILRELRVLFGQQDAAHPQATGALPAPVVRRTRAYLSPRMVIGEED